MLQEKFNKQGLLHFNYKNTLWYKKIKQERIIYKRMLFFLAIAITLLIIVFVLTSTYLGREDLVYFSLLVIFPAIAIQFNGTKKGSVWAGLFLLLLSVLYFGNISGLLPWVNVPRPFFLQWVMHLISYCFIWMLAFVAERRQESLLFQLTDMLVFDESTGLPDKDVLLHSIQREKSYIFAIIKIENFSDLVALFGYEFSDIISQFASQKLKKYESRYKYKTYQLKYNEYGVLIETEENLKSSDAVQKLHKIVTSLELEALPWEQDKIRLVYRVGATIVHPGDERSLLSCADIALKKAERSFSVLRMFDGDVAEKSSAYESVLKFTELITNRENNSLKAVFQPVFNETGKNVVWYEALLRIKKQDGQYVSIYPYLTVARSTGLYPYLTEFIMRESARIICEQDVDVSVNIAIHDISRPEFILLVDEIYKQIKLKKGRIIFEILESDELVELERCVWFIDYISQYGFKIAIDDFGTGYSNYCSLINLPIDIIKIDGSLIKRIHHDDNAKTLVEGIVLFCKRSNKKTVAEFVENEHVFDSLKTMSIDYLQGYYLGEPATIVGLNESPISGEDNFF